MRDTPASRDIPTSDELIRRAKKDFAPTVYSRTYNVVSRAEDIEQMVSETMDTEAMAKAMAETMDVDAMMDSSTSMGRMMSDRDERMVSERLERASNVPSPPVSTSTSPSGIQSGPAPASAYPSGTAGTDGAGSGKSVLRAVGLVILLALAGLWVFLIIGAAQSPDEAGSILGGGVVLTAIPLIFALLVLRAARKPKQSQGIIS